MPRTAGSKKYRREEIDKLLDLIDEIQPIGAEMWERIAEDYNRAARGNLWEERDADSLKVKFRGMVNHKKPTGDPQCPTPVKRAKRIKRSIENGIGCDDFDSAEDSQIHLAEDSQITPSPAFSPAPNTL